MSVDPKFKGFANQLFTDLEDMFNNLHYQKDDGRIEEAKETEKGIKEYLATQSYGLVGHALNSALLHERAYDLVRRYYKNEPIDLLDIYGFFNISAMLEEIPDLTKDT